MPRQKAPRVSALGIGKVIACLGVEVAAGRYTAAMKLRGETIVITLAPRKRK